MPSSYSSSPLVSIIIPNFNHARFLQKRLQSVMDQTFQDFEVFYIDDASTDNSNQVFAAFNNDNRIKAVFNKKNQGTPFKQWNAGVKLASGKYVWIAESDDFAEPTLLENLIYILESNSDVGIAYCQSMNIDENDVHAGIWKPAGMDNLRWQKSFVNNGLDECKNYLATVNTIPNASAVVFRREIFQKTGPAPENMRLAGDWLTWIKMLLESNIAHHAEPLNYFRRSTQSVSINAFVSSLRVRERYAVSGFLLQNIDFTSEQQEIILDKLFADWRTYAQSEPWWKSFHEHLRIFTLASPIDPKLLTRIFFSRN